LIEPISTPTQLTKRLFVKKTLRQQVRQIVDKDDTVSQPSVVANREQTVISGEKD
jgi:hypothetical protein